MIARARVMNSARASSLAIRSSSRWRKRVSTSFRPWNLSGGGRRLLASTAKSSTRSVSSPRLRAEDGAVDADEVAEVELEQARHQLLAEHVDARLQLDAARAVDEVEEGHLALPAAGGEAPGDAVARVGLLAGRAGRRARRATSAIGATPG